MQQADGGVEQGWPFGTPQQLVPEVVDAGVGQDDSAADLPVNGRIPVTRQATLAMMASRTVSARRLSVREGTVPVSVTSPPVTATSPRRSTGACDIAGNVLDFFFKFYHAEMAVRFQATLLDP